MGWRQEALKPKQAQVAKASQRPGLCSSPGFFAFRAREGRLSAGTMAGTGEGLAAIRLYPASWGGVSGYKRTLRSG